MAKPGPQKTNYEQMPARFAKGTLERIDKVLRKPGENRADFLRAAVEREVAHRSGGEVCEVTGRNDTGVHA